MILSVVLSTINPTILLTLPTIAKYEEMYDVYANYAFVIK